MAERSKAPDLSSGTRMCAWVRTPLLTSCFFFLSLKYGFQKLKIVLPQRGFEPRTFGLGIQRAIHCATRAVWDIKMTIVVAQIIFLLQLPKICDRVRTGVFMAVWPVTTSLTNVTHFKIVETL